MGELRQRYSRVPTASEVGTLPVLVEKQEDDLFFIQQENANAPIHAKNKATTFLLLFCSACANSYILLWFGMKVLAVFFIILLSALVVYKWHCSFPSTGNALVVSHVLITWSVLLVKELMGLVGPVLPFVSSVHLLSISKIASAFDAVFCILGAVLLFVEFATKNKFANKTFPRVGEKNAKRFLFLVLIYFLGRMTVHESRISQSLSGSFIPPPPVRMDETPSIIVISISSLHPNLFTREIFPKTIELLHPKNETHMCTEWKRHDSNGDSRDQGIAALLYNMPHARYQDILAHKQNPLIKSWPLETLRSQGYSPYRISPIMDLSFCWSILEMCDIHSRGVPRLPSGDTDEKVYDSASKWMKTSSLKPDFPYFLLIDLIRGLFPFKTSENPLSNLFLPQLSEQELYLYLQNKEILNSEELISTTYKLLNRVKNSFSNMDGPLSTFLNISIMPLLASRRQKTIFVLTSIPDEFSSFGSTHIFKDDISKKNQVPFFICGPQNIVSNLEIPGDAETNHIDVLPSILKATGANLGYGWITEENVQRRGQLAGNLRKLYSNWPGYTGNISGKIDTSFFGNHIYSDLQLTLPHHHQQQPSPSFTDSIRHLNDLTSMQKPLGHSFVTEQIKDPKHLRPSIYKFNYNFDIQSTNGSFVFDVFSMGSITRYNYLKAQIRTWASNSMIRSFSGFTERQDYDASCMSMTEKQVKLLLGAFSIYSFVNDLILRICSPLYNSFTDARSC